MKSPFAHLVLLLGLFLFGFIHLDAKAQTSPVTVNL